MSPNTTLASAQPPANPPAGTDDHVFIARQPIFEATKQNVFGYELLFRSSEENKFIATDGRFASSQTINRALHSIGFGVHGPMENPPEGRASSRQGERGGPQCDQCRSDVH